MENSYMSSQDLNKKNRDYSVDSSNNLSLEKIATYIEDYDKCLKEYDILFDPLKLYKEIFGTSYKKQARKGYVVRYKVISKNAHNRNTSNRKVINLLSILTASFLLVSAICDAICVLSIIFDFTFSNYVSTIGILCFSNLIITGIYSVICIVRMNKGNRRSEYGRSRQWIFE